MLSTQGTNQRQLGRDVDRLENTSCSLESGFPIFWLGIVIVSSLALRLSVFRFESIDYQEWFGPWYDFFIKHGRWHGLAKLTSDFALYAPLFMYLISLSTFLPLPQLYSIKLLSVACDYLAAWYVWRLVRRRGDGWRLPLIATAIFLFLPTVVMNGALWAQSDIMYTTGFLASLYYLLEKRPVAALVAFGFCCSLKPQSIFWCPLLAGMFLTKRLPWRLVWIPVAVYAVLSLPAIMAGRPASEVLLHWGRVRDQPGLVHYAPNWYQWVGIGGPQALWWIGIGLTTIFTVTFVWFVKQSGRQIDEQGWLVSLALLSVLFPPFFLPTMHDRYFFAADVLSVVYAFYVSGGWRAALLVQIASFFAYLPFLFGLKPISLTLLSILMVIALANIVKELWYRTSQPRI